MHLEMSFNAPAHTLLDKAKNDRELARLLKVRTPSVLTLERLGLNHLLVRYSTDYVLVGSGNYAGNLIALNTALVVFGQSKLGEAQSILAKGSRQLVLRASCVCTAYYGNVVERTRCLAQDFERATNIQRQWRAPISSDLLKDMTTHAFCYLPQLSEDMGKHLRVRHGETIRYNYIHFLCDIAYPQSLGLALKMKTFDPVVISRFSVSDRRSNNSRLNARNYIC